MNDPIRDALVAALIEARRILLLYAHSRAAPAVMQIDAALRAAGATIPKETKK